MKTIGKAMCVASLVASGFVMSNPSASSRAWAQPTEVKKTPKAALAPRANSISTVKSISPGLGTTNDGTALMFEAGAVVTGLRCISLKSGKQNCEEVAFSCPDGQAVFIEGCKTNVNTGDGFNSEETEDETYLHRCFVNGKLRPTTLACRTPQPEQPLEGSLLKRIKDNSIHRL